jgi:subtilisin
MRLFRYQPLLLLGILMLGVALVMGARGGSSSAAPSFPQTGFVHVFIEFDRMPGPAQAALIRNAGGNVEYNYAGFIPYVSAFLPAPAINGLSRAPGVKSIEEVGTAYAIGIDSGDAEYDWGVDRIDADNVQAGGLNGAGVKVAIIDSGVDTSHPDLVGRVVQSLSFVSSSTGSTSGTEDNCGHGTHVTGTVAANKNGFGVAGAAPGVSIYNLKVLELSRSIFGTSCSGSWASVAYAIQWAANNGIDVINMSLGGSSGNSALADAVAAAYNKGVVIVAAAGNSGNSAGTGDNVGYPAKYPQVIAVAATTSSDARASFSSTGPAVELAAPGASIKSTTPNNTYSTWDGTSMASPHVAGVAALVIQANPGMTNEEVRQRLRDTALDLGSAGKDDLYGYGLVMAPAAVGASGSPTPTPVPGTPTSTPTPTNTPTATPTATNTPPATNTPTPTNTPAASAMHVGDLDASVSRAFSSWTATVTIQVHSGTEQPVSGATVSGSFSNGGGSFKCKTSSSGLCTVTSKRMLNTTGSMTFSVTAVSKSGLAYTPGANHDPDGDSDGTSIVITR